MSEFSNWTITQTNNNNIHLLYEAVVYSLALPLVLITAIGNGIILVTIKFQARLLSLTSNYFILSLALADFFVGVLIMPIMTIYTARHGYWPFHQILCDLWMSIDFLCSSASFLTLTCMSIERYRMLTQIHRKHRNSSSSSSSSKRLISLSWLLPTLTWIPIIVTFRFIYGPNKKGDCALPIQAQTLVLIISILLYHFPFILMVYLTVKLIIHIQKSSVNRLLTTQSHEMNHNDSTFITTHAQATSTTYVEQHHNNIYCCYISNNYYCCPQSHNTASIVVPRKSTTGSVHDYTSSFVQHRQNVQHRHETIRIKRNKKALRMLVILVLSFSICWLPFIVFYPLTQYFPQLLPNYVTAIIWWMGYTNSVLNPFLYVYTNKNIRRSVRNLFHLNHNKHSHHHREDSINQNCNMRNRRLLNFVNFKRK